MIQPPEITVSFIGAGRLAWSLIPAFQAAGICVEGIYSRDRTKAASYARTYEIDQHGGIPESESVASDLLLLTVADHAVAWVARKLRVESRQMVCHCSGSVSIDALAHIGRYGVFYPMQAFTDQKVVDFQEDKVPVFVEGNSKELTSQLLEIGGRMAHSVQELSSAQRKKLHLGAVLACNFPNLLFRYAAQQVEGVGLEAYESLIRHQVNQAMALGPAQAQTGPAIRGDEDTLRAHLDLLSDQPALQELYRLLSRMINPDLPDSL